ncbi:PaaI family thioesterase [Roseivivax sp. CAU 1753]
MEDRIRDSFARQSMMATLGASLSEIRKGAVAVTAPIGPGTMQQQGFGHAGLTFSLGDTAAGYSALSLLDADREVVTSEIGIHLLAPARGDRLVARGRVIKPGRRLIVVSSEVFAVTGTTETLVAILHGTMVPVAAG